MAVRSTGERIRNGILGKCFINNTYEITAIAFTELSAIGKRVMLVAGVLNINNGATASWEIAGHQPEIALPPSERYVSCRRERIFHPSLGRNGDAGLCGSKSGSDAGVQ